MQKPAGTGQTEQCETCKGQGKVQGKGGQPIICPTCRGSGRKGYWTK